MQIVFGKIRSDTVGIGGVLNHLVKFNDTVKLAAVTEGIVRIKSPLCQQRIG